MIQILSFESTDTPMVFPITQWFGSGFGHIGFTSNLGACPPEAAATARLWSTTEPTPSAATTATRPAPTLSLCVITDLPSCIAADLILKNLGHYTRFSLREPAPSGGSWVCLKSLALRIPGSPVERARMSDTWP